MQNRIPNELRREIAEASRYVPATYLELALGISKYTVGLIRREARFEGQSLAKVELPEADRPRFAEQMRDLKRRLLDVQSTVIQGEPDWLMELGRELRAMRLPSSRNGSIPHN
jgi:hypothetical protein